MGGGATGLGVALDAAARGFSVVLVSRSGLVTVTGGKWTTCRAMAEDVLDQCFEQQLLTNRPKGVTAHLFLLGSAGKGAVNDFRSAGRPACMLMGMSKAAFWPCRGRMRNWAVG